MILIDPFGKLCSPAYCPLLKRGFLKKYFPFRNGAGKNGDIPDSFVGEDFCHHP